MTKYFSLLVLVALLASGCARAQAAKTTPDGPPLDVPAPPPRDVELGGTELAPTPVPLPQEPARNAPPTTRVRPTAPRENRPDPPKPEAPKVEPPPEAPKPPTEESKPPSTLQTKPASEEGEVERTIRLALTRATNDLNRVDYRTLNTEARAQYDSAKLFIRQAEDLVRQKNMMFAKTIADKAATLAAQLAGR
jgi:outer membrane biosynthesis protein TonB